MALERLNTVMRVDQRRIGVYGAAVYPASTKNQTPARIRMIVEVGEQPAVVFIENVRDGRMELDPDALGHAESGKALHRACESEGVSFYRLAAGLARALEDMTRPFALPRYWIERELAALNASIKPGADHAPWDVQRQNASERIGVEGFECLHDVAFAFGLSIMGDKPRQVSRG